MADGLTLAAAVAAVAAALGAADRSAAALGAAGVALPPAHATDATAIPTVIRATQHRRI
jgi:hypothetical protein